MIRLVAGCCLAWCLMLASSQLRAADPPPEKLTGHAAELFKKAQAGKFYSRAAALKPEYVPTTDAESFLVIWKSAAAPKRWIVSLPGRHGLATDELAIWHPHLKDREVGMVVVQWWLGEGDDARAYLSPQKIYREVDLTMQKLKVAPGSVMLHGFSRGSANSFAVMALDQGRGRKYFSLAVASSGGVATDYPPTRSLMKGEFGERPLAGTRWITSAGGKDPDPEQGGIPAMRRTATWLKEQGAIVVESIEYPSTGHGALVLNPKNVHKVLDLFFSDAKK